jgi:hypothetical protein
VRWPAVTLACVALTGCAALTPVGGTTPTPASSTASPPPNPRLAIAQATHEYPAAAPPRERAAGGEPTAADAIRAFATAYINWGAGTVAREMLVLAAESVGQARSATELAAAQTAGDYELRRGGIANSGTVEAVVPLAGRPDRYLVVTRERTTATNTDAYAGLAPAWHITVATAEQLAPGRWVVSGWQPEN